MGHYYTSGGDACYQVPYAGKREGMRDTTITDARKLNLYPSVTELFNLLSKEGLYRWKEGMLLEATWQHEGGFFESFEQYKKIITSFVKQEAERAPKLGSKIHDELEQWYKSGANLPPNDRIAKAVFTVREEVGKYDYIAERSFAHPLGFGGKVDLHAKAISGRVEDEPSTWYTDIVPAIVLDFKTKDTTDVKKMKGYDEHIMQLAAYRHGLGTPKARCYNLFVSSQDPSLVVLVEYEEEKLVKAWEMFKCLLRYWQLSNSFPVKEQ